MAETLGEKLRQAREERGISISEVAEQTRISPLYIDSIEKNDFKTLPGGIFNKGFIKSYAKFVGYDEHQALAEYQKAIAAEEAAEPDLKVYRPEVLTDDRSAASLAPTIIFAAIILGLVSAGILFLVNYVQNRGETPIAANTANINSNGNANTNSQQPAEPVGAIPSMQDLKVEFSTISDDVSVTAVADGRSSSILVSKEKPAAFSAKENLKISYSKSLVDAARLKINGRDIELPREPENPRRAAIEFVINKDTLAAIWQKGRIAFGEETPTPTETPATETTAEQTHTPNETPAPTAAPVQTPRSTPRPAATPTKTPTPRSTPKPSPSRQVIVVGEPTPRAGRTP
jgi:cytoskeletal protein RodZ